jgi:hypothetical protein
MPQTLHAWDRRSRSQGQPIGLFELTVLIFWGMAATPGWCRGPFKRGSRNILRGIVVGMLLSFSQIQEVFAQSKNVQDAIDVIATFCVAGGMTSEVSVTGKDGGVELKREGGAGITISKSEARGLVDGIRREMSNISANQASEARKCMQPYIDRILDSLLGRALPAGTPPKPGPDPAPTYQNAPSPTTAALLQKISASRWCTSRRSYTLQLTGNSIVWRDSFGSIDMERIVYNNAAGAQTVTVNSTHTGGDGVPTGTTWTYSSNGVDRIDVSRNGEKSFSLNRC